MSERMHDRNSGTKPRVFKIRDNGMWWADVRTADGVYVCDVFPTYEQAIAQSREYARGNTTKESQK